MNKRIVAIIAGLALVGAAITAQSYILVDAPAQEGTFRTYEFFATTTANGTAPSGYSTTTSATSTLVNSWIDENGRVVNGVFRVAGAKKVTFFFSRSAPTGTNSGSSIFNVEVTNDGSTWTRYNKLITNVTNTNAQNVTRAETVTISAATSTVIATMDPDDSVYAIRCIAVEATDGYHRCSAAATF